MYGKTTRSFPSPALTPHPTPFVFLPQETTVELCLREFSTRTVLEKVSKNLLMHTLDTLIKVSRTFESTTGGAWRSHGPEMPTSLPLEQDEDAQSTHTSTTG